MNLKTRLVQGNTSRPNKEQKYLERTADIQMQSKNKLFQRFAMQKFQNYPKWAHLKNFHIEPPK